MAVYELTADAITPLSETTFESERLRERGDLQRLLRDHVEVLDPGLYVIAEEFGAWEDSRRRVDLLCIDRDANLVVVELKRDEVGGHMELQAVRYAAMLSTMTLDQVVEAHRDYLSRRAREQVAREAILRFLGWVEPEEGSFAPGVRIVLGSAEFSKELTTSVLWLNEQGLDIRCVRLKPYTLGGRVLLDVQQVVPLPELAEYQVRLREKARQERVARAAYPGAREYAKYDVTAAGRRLEGLGKGRAIHAVVRALCLAGVTPDEIAGVIGWQPRLWYAVEGEVDAESFRALAEQRGRQEGRAFDVRRWFHAADELIHTQGRTYAFTTQWGTQTDRALGELLGAFPDHGVRYERNA